MNFSNLSYFLIAAEDLNFTNAARKLHISQQSLSNHIAKLENHFGVRLFDRTPPMTLTQAGQSLLKNTRLILSLRNQTESEINDIKDFRSGTVSIAVTNARGTAMLPALLPEFHKKFPQLRINLFEGTSAEIEDALYKGKVDISIGFAINDPEIVDSLFLLEERSVIVVPKQILVEYFADQGEALFAQKGQKIPLLSFSHCPFVAIKATTWAGAVFYNCCRELNITPKIVVEVANIKTMLALCLEGMGIAVCPQIFVTQIPQHRDLIHENFVELAEIFDLDYASADTFIAVNYLKGKYLSLASREFIKMAKALLKQH